MARADAYKTTTESPVKKYLSWSSNDKCFTYWDKATEKNQKLPLPIKLVHLDDMSCIKGWHDSSSSGIYSNEIKNTGAEPLVVKAFKGGTIAEGLYKDIKLKVNGLGGDYHASLYFYLNGEVVNLAIKGAALMVWSDFAKENRKSFLGNYIEVTGALDAKKGSVKYSTPVMAVGGIIDKSVNENAEDAYDTLQKYFASRKASANVAVEELVAEEVPTRKFEEAPVEDPSDLLPF
jgi:hypothetical protein